MGLLYLKTWNPLMYSYSETVVIRRPIPDLHQDSDVILDQCLTYIKTLMYLNTFVTAITFCNIVILIFISLSIFFIGFIIRTVQARLFTERKRERDLWILILCLSSLMKYTCVHYFFAENSVNRKVVTLHYLEHVLWMIILVCRCITTCL